MQKINFTHNWTGNLFCDAFGTVRIYNPAKHVVGAELEIYLKQYSLGTVEVVAVRMLKFNQINDALAYLIIGKPAPYLANLITRFYGREQITSNTMLAHIICQYRTRNLPVQQQLLQEWWQGTIDKTPFGKDQFITH